MSLSSASSYDDAVNQFLDNLNYRTSNGAAVLAAEALDYIFIKRPRNSSSGIASMTWEDLKEIRKEIGDIVKGSSTTNRSMFTRAKLTRP